MSGTPGSMKYFKFLLPPCHIDLWFPSTYSSADLSLDQLHMQLTWGICSYSSCIVLHTYIQNSRFKVCFSGIQKLMHHFKSVIRILVGVSKHRCFMFSWCRCWEGCHSWRMSVTCLHISTMSCWNSKSTTTTAQIFSTHNFISRQWYHPSQLFCS